MRPVIYILVLFCLMACKPTGKSVSESIDLDNLSSPSLYDYFSEIEIIPLETSEQSLISGIQEIAYYCNKYYIMDRKSKRIVIFSDKGKYLGEINKLGQGPGEYTELWDFRNNPFTNDVELLAPMGGILRYDSLGYDFKGKVELPDGVRALHYFMPMDEDVYLLFSESQEGDKMFIYDSKEEKIMRKMYDIPEFILFNTPYRHSHSPYYVYDREIHFVQGYNGDVYTIDRDGMHLKYHWDFGDKNFDISRLEEHPISYYMEYVRTIGAKYANTFTTYGENSKYYITTFLYNHKIYCLVYDKQKKRVSVFNKFREGHVCIPAIIDENALYSYVNPSMPGIQLNPDALDEKIKKQIDQIAPEDNPYIIKYKFK